MLHNNLIEKVSPPPQCWVHCVPLKSTMFICEETGGNKGWSRWMRRAQISQKPVFFSARLTFRVCPWAICKCVCVFLPVCSGCWERLHDPAVGEAGSPQWGGSGSPKCWFVPLRRGLCWRGASKSNTVKSRQVWFIYLYSALNRLWIESWMNNEQDNKWDICFHIHVHVVAILSTNRRTKAVMFSECKNSQISTDILCHSIKSFYAVWFPKKQTPLNVQFLNLVLRDFLCKTRECIKYSRPALNAPIQVTKMSQMWLIVPKCGLITFF